MREFIGLMTFDYDEAGVYKIINDVYSAVIAMLPQESIQNVMYLIVFLLCFCSQDKTVILVLYLFELKAQIKDQNETILKCIKAFPWGN